MNSSTRVNQVIGIGELSLDFLIPLTHAVLDKDIGKPHLTLRTICLSHGFYRLRSYLGYPPVRDALPNTTHYAIAALQHTSFVERVITQNVDGLHHKALRSVWNEKKIEERILELHGSLHVRAILIVSRSLALANSR
jgi:hypothetical protein